MKFSLGTIFSISFFGAGKSILFSKKTATKITISTKDILIVIPRILVLELVFLIMMGTGKTSIGELVSKRLNLNFFDIDQYIENESKMKISKIFSSKGEKFFRELEEKKTLNLLKKKNSVIALGGGAFLNQNIRGEILKNHLSFWLDLSTELIISRIKNSSKRPIAAQATKDELVNLIKKRSNIYSKAMYKVKCDGLTKKEIVDKIIKIYETD